MKTLSGASQTIRYIAAQAARCAVLFDVDGTLVDSNDAHADSWRAACASFGYERDTAFFRPLIGMGADHILPLIDPSLNDAESPGKEIAAARGEAFRSRHLATVRPTRGARDLVDALHRAGWLCVIATSAQPNELEALLRIVDVEEMIAIRATSEDASNSKPAPDIVEAALRKAGIEPSDAFLLGDTRFDIDSATAAGVPTIALRSGGSSDADLVGAREIYDDPADLLASLGQRK
jgi:HAD superfamily hydrolase (TIGR01509 family)